MKKQIAKRRARVKLDTTEPAAWKIATEILRHIANHPGPPLDRDDLRFLLDLAITAQSTVTRKQRSQIEEMASIYGGTHENDEKA